MKSFFPEVFLGLGKLDEPYTIKLKPKTKSFCLGTPRRIPLPLEKAVKLELKSMEEQGVISKVNEPTDWCSGMVVVPKSNGKVRICVDFTKLNENVCRELHMLPTVDETLLKLSGAKVFSKLDANSGFWQIPLAEELKHLTTFITPVGRFCFNRLPFGICSAPKHFQRRISYILENLSGVLRNMNDIIVFGETQKQHDKRLVEVLRKLAQAGVTLNKKCEFSKSSLKYLGHIVSSEGIKADPDKISAIKNMSAPTDVSGVRRLLGMVNQLAKFLPNLADMTSSLRELLFKKNSFCWSEMQQQAFVKIQNCLTTLPVLSHYNPNYKTVVASDSSSYGLGAVLMQMIDGKLKSICYASRSLTATEQRHAQIEKEALVITWACERFRNYLIGLSFVVQTDYKPLITLFGNKNLDELSSRIQRFRMRLMWFSYKVVYVPGKLLSTADALSRSPVCCVDIFNSDLCFEVENHVDLFTCFKQCACKNS